MATHEILPAIKKNQKQQHSNDVATYLFSTTIDRSPRMVPGSLSKHTKTNLCQLSRNVEINEHHDKNNQLERMPYLASGDVAPIILRPVHSKDRERSQFQETIVPNQCKVEWLLCMHLRIPCFLSMGKNERWRTKRRSAVSVI